MKSILNKLDDTKFLLKIIKILLYFIIILLALGFFVPNDFIRSLIGSIIIILGVFVYFFIVQLLLYFVFHFNDEL